MRTGAEAIRIEVIGLDQKGYGVDGNLTRREWQLKCHEMLRTGARNFFAWQQELINRVREIKGTRKPPSFNFRIEYEDGEKSPAEIGLAMTSDNEYFALDLAGLTIDDLSLDNFQIVWPTTLAGTIFQRFISASQISFRDQVLCQGVYFQGGAFFDTASFSSGAIFDYASFAGLAFFSQSVTPGVLCFRHADFQHQAHFEGAQWLHLYVQGARFCADADFSATIPIGKREPIPTGLTNASGASFLSWVDFSNRDFTGALVLDQWEGESTRFAKAPRFHNCKLHQNTTFADCEFLQRDNGEPTASLAYNTLRLAMSQKQSVHEEQIFLRLELDSERSRKSGPVKYLYEAYRFFSNYGGSLWRPIALLIFLPMTGCSLIYGAMASDPGCQLNWTCSIDIERVKKVIEYSFLNGLPPLGIDDANESARKGLLEKPLSVSPLALMVVAFLQKFAALFGWFLAALALRNQFKMK